MTGLIFKYFVLRPSTKDSHGIASIAAIRHYAEVIAGDNPELAADLKNWMDRLDGRSAQPERIT